MLAILVGLACATAAEPQQHPEKNDSPEARIIVGTSGELIINSSSNSLPIILNGRDVLAEINSLQDANTALQSTLLDVTGQGIYKIGGGGGVFPTVDVATVEVYNPVSGKWTPRTPLPAPTRAAATTAYGSQIYLLGGQPPERGQEFLQLSVRTGHWSALDLPPLPQRVFRGTAVTVGSKILLIGGAGDFCLASIYAFDVSTMSWMSSSPIANMAVGRMGTPAVERDGLVYITGGIRRAFRLDSETGFYTDIVNTMEIFDHEAELATFKTPAPPPMPHARGNHAAFFVNNTVLLVGGANSTGYVWEVDCYIIDEDRWVTLGRIQMPEEERAGNGGANLNWASGVTFAIGGELYLVSNGGISYVDRFDPVTLTLIPVGKGVNQQGGAFVVTAFDQS